MDEPIIKIVKSVAGFPVIFTLAQRFAKLLKNNNKKLRMIFLNDMSFLILLYSLEQLERSSCSVYFFGFETNLKI